MVSVDHALRHNRQIASSRSGGSNVPNTAVTGCGQSTTSRKPAPTANGKVLPNRQNRSGQRETRCGALFTFKTWNFSGRPVS